MNTYRIDQLEVCHREMFGDLVLTCQNSSGQIETTPYKVRVRRATVDLGAVVKKNVEMEQRRASDLVEKLLMDIYNNIQTTITDYNSTSGKSHKSSWMEVVNLQEKGVEEIFGILSCLRNYVERMGSVLVRQLKRRDALRRQRDAYCDVITKQLFERVPQGECSDDMRFTIQPLPGDTGFSQWVTAMKMVAQLPGGIPSEFRRRLWLQLADKHLAAKGVDWPKVERTCFSEWSHPSDAELGVQIVKDLHRTGCSLFCGEDGQENQVLLKRVLLAYARWNKAVGYCQGFNMLAALILQVTEKSESDALKLMIYLIEGVLPDSYFADSLRGLSVDMAVFREFLRTRFPRLSKHLDTLQSAAKDGSRSYEPPLTNVFTMQWFLTLFCNCLPQPTVLRVWDLILLEGNEILLRTALAIWQVLADRILSVRSADEFYCMMGVLTRELLESELVDGNSLIKAVVAIGPLTELNTLREHYLYNINPWSSTIPQAVDKQLKLYPKQSIALDISGLKKQYVKLKQRQRQAHIIFTAAISGQSTPTAPVTMNHLLIGKSALIPAKRIGPPKGAIPPARQTTPSTLHWKDAPKQTSSSSSSDTELCDEGSESSSDEDANKPSQFENSTIDSDNSLIKNDNIVVVDKHKEEDNLIVFKSESDDECYDFEEFLSDRLKVTDEDAEEKVNFARRNSERALQIIQENSLILHRILQCQSRLSPSPPLLEALEPLDDEEKSPEYGSRYSSILEKSKSLDEKYNALILNKPIQLKYSNDNISEETSNELVSIRESSSDNSEDKSKYLNTKEKGDDLETFKYNIEENSDTIFKYSTNKKTDGTCEESSNICEENKGYDFEASNNVIKEKMFSRDIVQDYFPHYDLSKEESDIHSTNKSKEVDNSGISNEIPKTHSTYKYDKSIFYPTNRSLLEESSKSQFEANTCYNDVDNCDITRNLSLDVVPCTSSKLKSPLRSPGKSPFKSPSKTFNPFPVPLSSRQNKEVPLKLGLYRK